VTGHDPVEPIVDELEDLCQCQGCGAYADISKLGEPHFCHKAADGTYEEGGTFQ
jgi:hypothetical protein